MKHCTPLSVPHPPCLYVSKMSIITNIHLLSTVVVSPSLYYSCCDNIIISPAADWNSICRLFPLFFLHLLSSFFSFVFSLHQWRQITVHSESASVGGLLLCFLPDATGQVGSDCPQTSCITTGEGCVSDPVNLLTTASACSSVSCFTCCKITDSM